MGAISVCVPGFRQQGSYVPHATNSESSVWSIGAKVSLQSLRLIINYFWINSSIALGSGLFSVVERGDGVYERKK